MTAPYQFPALAGTADLRYRGEAEAVSHVYQLSNGRTLCGASLPVLVHLQLASTPGAQPGWRGYRVRIKRRPFLVRVGVVLRRMFA